MATPEEMTIQIPDEWDDEYLIRPKAWLQETLDRRLY